MSAQTQFEGVVERAPSGGWLIRVPLRREDVRLEKRTVIAERLVISRRQVQDVEQVQADVRREQLRVDGDDIEATQPLETTTRLDREAHRERLVSSTHDSVAAERTQSERLR